MTDPAGRPTRTTKLRAGLMDPDNPRPAPRRGNDMSLETVQRWVLSVLAVSTVLHFAGGLVLAAYVADKPSAQVGLLVLAGLMGAMGVGAGLLIHRRTPLSPWLALGSVPALVGAYLMFWR